MAQQLVVVGLDTLSQLDMGKIKEALNLHIRRCAIDCKDRPGDKKSRKATMTVMLTPNLEPDGSCDRVSLEVEFSSSIPNHRTKAYDCGLRANGSLTVNPDSLDCVDQATLFDDEA